MKTLFQEFKKFAVRGNVVDLAVGIVIGSAFGTIVSSFVEDVLMPPIGLLLGDKDFTKFAWIIKDAVVRNGETAQEAIALNYGLFIQHVIDFVIIAFAIFLVVKAMNKLQRKEEEKSSNPPADVRLLTEIRDLLKKKSDHES